MRNDFRALMNNKMAYARRAKRQLSPDRDGRALLMLTHTLSRFRLLTVAALLLLATTINRAQQIPIASGATDFNSVQYYGPPHQQDIEHLFSGAEAEPLPGGLLLIKQVKIERFDLTGKLLLVAEAPECIYDPVNDVASSAGEIHVRTGDGKLKIDGEGFLWRKNDSLFTISNQVNTVIEKMSALKQ